MAKRLHPRLDILPAPQRRLWDELGPVPAPFVLYGGTAIALLLGHRQSEDFDFFSDRTFEPIALHATLPFLAGSRITQSEPSTLTCFVDRGGPIKVSFFGVPHLARIRAPFVVTGSTVKIADLIDLAGTKAAVVQARAQMKDYLDIDAMIASGIDLPTQLAAGRLIYGEGFAPTETLKALTYFGDGDLSSLPDDVKRRLATASTGVDPLHLPSIRRTVTRRPERGPD